MQNQYLSEAFDHMLPSGLDARALAAWSEMIGLLEAHWLRVAGGPRMHHVKDAKHFVLLVDQTLDMSPAIFGLAYSRLVDIMHWSGPVDETHPFSYIPGMHVDDITRQTLARIHRCAVACMARIEDQDPGYANSQSLLMSKTSLDSLQRMANQAPTAFALGLATGWLVLHEWRNEITRQSPPGAPVYDPYSS